MSASLSSSLDILSLTSSTRWASDSFSDEDEIVWSLSSSAVLSSSSPLNSPLSETADYVLVPRIDSGAGAAPVVAATNPAAPPSADAIAEQMAALSLSAVSQQRRTDVPTTTPSAPAPAPAAAAKKKGGCQAGNKKATAPPPPSPPAASRRSQDGAPPTTAPPAAPRTAKRKKAKKVKAVASTAAAGHGPSTAAAPSNVAKKSEKKKKKKLPGDGAAPAAAAKKKSAAGAGAGARAPAPDHVPLSPAAADHVTVDGAGEQRSASASGAMAGYHEAQKYMTSYLAHPPPPGNNGSALLMLQALILELGCLPSAAAGKFSIPELPGTLRQAKLLLKSRAFINVRDYLAVREQGQTALRRVMHPSRNSLVQEVRKGKRIPVHDVKKAGLKVLLVNTRR